MKKRVVVEYSLTGTDGPWYPMERAVMALDAFFFPAFLKGDRDISRDRYTLGDVHVRHREVVTIENGDSWTTVLDPRNHSRYTVCSAPLSAMADNTEPGSEYTVCAERFKDGKVVSRRHVILSEAYIIHELSSN